MASMTKSQKRLIVVLLLVLAFAAFDFIKNSDEYFSFYSGEKTTERKTSGDTKIVRANVQGQGKKEQAYLQNWGRDPFFDKSLVKTYVRVKREVPLILTAISYQGENSMVMINNKILTLGDQIEGFQVASIDETQVLLRKGDQTKILRLK
jgi:hypothetical protein